MCSCEMIVLRVTDFRLLFECVCMVSAFRLPLWLLMISRNGIPPKARLWTPQLTPLPCKLVLTWKFRPRRAPVMAVVQLVRVLATPTIIVRIGVSYVGTVLVRRLTSTLTKCLSELMTVWRSTIGAWWFELLAMHLVLRCFGTKKLIRTAFIRYVCLTEL